MGKGRKPKKAEKKPKKAPKRAQEGPDLDDIDIEEVSLSDIEALASELSEGEGEALMKELRKDPEMAAMMDDVEKALKKGGKGKGKGKGPKKPKKEGDKKEGGGKKQ